MKKIILASSSIYRRQLLQKLNIEFDTAAPDINELANPKEDPKQLALRLAIEKADALKPKYPNHLIIGSDQVAVFNSHILGKPGNFENTIKQLELQSGNKVTFYTSVCVMDADSGQYFFDTDLTTTYFKKLSTKQISRYVELDTPFDCAGGFKAEGLGICLFDKIEGEDPNALIGLPLIKLIKILEKFNHPIL